VSAASADPAWWCREHGRPCPRRAREPSNRLPHAAQRRAGDPADAPAPLACPPCRERDRSARHEGGDADLEPEVTEQDDESEIDDETEEDDHGGGNVEDEGESAEAEDSAGCGTYGINQSLGPLSLHTR
jgi:hypothetical protein